MKKTYSAPVLTAYGSAVARTLGNFGGMVEVNTTRRGIVE